MLALYIGTPGFLDVLVDPFGFLRCAPCSFLSRFGFLYWFLFVFPVYLLFRAGTAQFSAGPYRARLCRRARMLDVLHCLAMFPKKGDKKGIGVALLCVFRCPLALLVWRAATNAAICSKTRLKTIWRPKVLSAFLWFAMSSCVRLYIFQALCFHALLVLAKDLNSHPWLLARSMAFWFLYSVSRIVVLAHESGGPRSNVVHSLAHRRILFILCSSAKISNPPAIGR